MIERPILFSAPMCNAILAGTKTQTRRVIADKWWVCLDPEDADDRAQALTMCPYGVAGDRLWVRETWGLLDTEPADGPQRAHVFFRATNGDRRDLRYQRWRPSIHMPRWASRITLEVIGVRVERLQDISGKDACAEGIERHDDDGVTYYGPLNRGHADPRVGFSWLWDAINGKRPGCSWETNPWVWCVAFRRVQP